MDSLRQWAVDELLRHIADSDATIATLEAEATAREIILSSAITELEAYRSTDEAGIIRGILDLEDAARANRATIAALREALEQLLPIAETGKVWVINERGDPWPEQWKCLDRARALLAGGT